MTERLSKLLRDEAAGVPVPAPPVEDVLASGRSIRRRRTAVRSVLAAAAAVVVVAGGAAVLSMSRGEHDPAPVDDPTAYDERGAWAWGDEVHVGNHTAIVAGATGLQYTSAGVVVSGRDGYHLVTPSGDVEPLDLDLGDQGLRLPRVVTDPASPYLAYVKALDGDRQQLVVRDLESGEEQRVGKPSPGDDLTVPATAWMWGDEVSYSDDGVGRVVNWRTGARQPTPQGWWFSGGRSIEYDTDGTWSVLTPDGDLVLSVPSSDPDSSYGTVSPDGRYLAVYDAESGTNVYDIDTGRSVELEGRSLSNYGWTPDGHLVGSRSASEAAELEVCDPATGDCEGTGTDVEGGVTLVQGVPGYAPGS